MESTMGAHDLCLSRPPVARAAMLVRAPAAEVFEALVDPAVTSRFWFTKGSARLEPGATVRWEWEMYGVAVEVDVKEVEPQRRIRFEWDGYAARETVEFTFESRSADTTFVSVTNAIVGEDGDTLVAQVLDATEGFTLVLAGLKALLEQGVVLNLVWDRHPEGVGAG